VSSPEQWIWMREIFGIATKRAHEALSRYGCPETILGMSGFDADRDEFLNDAERGLIKARDLSRARDAAARAKSMGAAIVTPDSPQYPRRLNDVYSPPMVMFAKGDLSLLNSKLPVAMVGAREPDGYGLRCAWSLSGGVAKAGGLVISGLARGIDAACHKGALDAKGATVALVAAGLDICYPAENRALRSRIEENGLVLSEYEAGTRPLAHHFVVRNRIISGMSLAVVVVQAQVRSGSLNTASHAAEQGRDVFAVPGDIFNQKMLGCHTLLFEGAAPAISGEMIISQISQAAGVCAPQAGGIAWPFDAPDDAPRPHAGRKESKNPSYQSVYRALCERPMEFEEIIGIAKIQDFELMALLTEMEINGSIESLPGGKYQAL
jgi:DNA processing protein